MFCDVKVSCFRVQCAVLSTAVTGVGLDIGPDQPDAVFLTGRFKYLTMFFKEYIEHNNLVGAPLEFITEHF